MGCSNDDARGSNRSLIGTWKLIEVYNNPGYGPGSWNSVENGYTYTFYTFGQFTSTRFSECSSGNYAVTSDEVALNFGCDGFTTGIESPAGTFIEQLTFESNTVIFNPTYLSCAEGCGWKFEKIN